MMNVSYLACFLALNHVMLFTSSYFMYVCMLTWIVRDKIAQGLKELENAQFQGKTLLEPGFQQVTFHIVLVK